MGIKPKEVQDHHPKLEIQLWYPSVVFNNSTPVLSALFLRSTLALSISEAFPPAWFKASLAIRILFSSEALIHIKPSVLWREAGGRQSSDLGVNEQVSSLTWLGWLMYDYLTLRWPFLPRLPLGVSLLAPHFLTLPLRWSLPLFH